MQKFLITAALLCSSAMAWAGDADELLQPQFQFRHQEISVKPQYITEQTHSFAFESTSEFDRTSQLAGKLNQYDATFSYPFRSRNAVNLDLGVNLRFINGELQQSEFAENSQYELNAALPMFYANALFQLPYDGLSASFGASHLEYNHYYALDYKAKLSYQWQNGLGLEGGWQHQQLSIDDGGIQAEIENKGMFLDLKYRF